MAIQQPRYYPPDDRTASLVVNQGSGPCTVSRKRNPERILKPPASLIGDLGYLE